MITLIVPGSPDVGDVYLCGASLMQAKGKGYAPAGLTALTALSDLWCNDHAASWRAGIGGARIVGRDTMRDLLDDEGDRDGGVDLLPVGLPPTRVRPTTPCWKPLQRSSAGWSALRRRDKRFGGASRPALTSCWNFSGLTLA